MDATYDPIIDLIPQGYRGIAIVLFVGIPYLTRAYHALANNGGLKGVWNAIMFGTNGPKILIASLALLTLTNCTGITAFLASAAGKATEAVALQMSKDLAERGEVIVLKKSIDSLNVTIAKYEALPQPSGIADQLILAAKLDGLKAAKAGAQQQLKGLTGEDYPIACGPKQPVMSSH